MSNDASRNAGPLARVFALLTAIFAGWATWEMATARLPPLAASGRGRIDDAITLNLIVSGVVFLGAHLAIVIILLRRPRETRIPRENVRVEALWTALTALVLVALLINAEIDTRALSRGRESSDVEGLKLEVVGQQFAWNFRFPGEDGIFGRTDPRLIDPGALNFIGIDRKDPAAEDDVVLPQSYLILPVGREVRVRLRSLDVIHSFFVAPFRVKRDAMPGIAIEFTFTPSETGTYELVCAEMCGLGHYRMRGTIDVVPAAEWAARVKEATQ